MRDGAVDFVGGSAHSALAAFPEFRGAKLICAQAQGMYWFLIMHADLGAKRGDLSIVKGRSIGAAPWVDKGLRGLLAEAGIDLVRDGVTIAPVPGAAAAGINFGLTAARALEDRKIDGFWANGMGAEVALRRGVGTMVLDVRRGDGPKACFNYTAATIAATDALIARSPDQAAAAVRAIVKTQNALKADVTRAAEVGKKLFPPSEAGLITDLIRRDLPYYDASLSPGLRRRHEQLRARPENSRSRSRLRRRRRDRVQRFVERLSRSSGGAISVTRSLTRAFFGRGASFISPSRNRVVHA